jgi:hypothetical protein
MWGNELRSSNPVATFAIRYAGSSPYGELDQVWSLSDPNPDPTTCVAYQDSSAF